MQLKYVFVLFLFVVSFVPASAQIEKPKKGKLPTQAELYAGMGLNSFEKKDYNQAIVYFKKALDLDKKNTSYAYEIALANGLLGKIDEAIEQLKPLLERTDAKDIYYKLLGNLYAEKDDTTNSRSAYEEGLKKFPKSAKLKMELGLIEYYNRRLIEAIELFEDAIQIEPSYPTSYYWASKCYLPTPEKLWTVLYGEVSLHVESNLRRSSESVLNTYNAYRLVFNEFDSLYKINKSDNIVMNFSRTQKGSTDANRPITSTFESAFEQSITPGARTLNYFRDFELPIGSLDTIRTDFVKTWFARGWDKKYPNALFSYWKKLQDNGLFTCYTFHVFRDVKPLEFQAYMEKNKTTYEKLKKFMTKNPFTIGESNKFSRYNYE
jgi:tetratricopeptide (TPR) repeat protein